jgi:hypothetical protein
LKILKTSLSDGLIPVSSRKIILFDSR